MKASGSSFAGSGLVRFIEKTLEHLGIGQEMQPALGRF
jgi:hypothetical protein